MVLIRRSSSICSNRINESLPLSSSAPSSSYHYTSKQPSRLAQKFKEISKRSNNITTPFILAILLTVGFRFKYSSLQNELLTLSKDHSMIQKELDQEITMNSFVVENWRKFQKEFKEEKEILKISLTKKKEKVEAREEKLREKVEFLHARVQRESHREIRERFGVGPHKVKFEVVLPQNKRTGITSNFTVQLASIDHMPHAVHLFLEQVHHKLWDETAFVINDHHILQTAPTDEDFYELFEGYELDSLAFEEYSPLYPHEKYTLGYAGRPAGPLFYVNKLNNTEWHGPGGQEFKYVAEEADPCFGKIVDGFDIIDQIFDLEENDSYLKENVLIKRATWWDEGKDRDEDIAIKEGH